VKTKRGLIAIFVGILTSLLCLVIVAGSLRALTGIKLLQFYSNDVSSAFNILLCLLLIPIFIGGLVASIMARDKGWIYGLAHGAILWWVVFLLGMSTGDFLIQSRANFNPTLYKSIIPAADSVRTARYERYYEHILQPVMSVVGWSSTEVSAVMRYAKYLGPPRAGGFLVEINHYYPLLLRQGVIALCASFIMAGMVGGFLGQLLAQNWHKRTQNKADASPSETS
jgi:putative membrane protein (TIGR04086 family)